MSQVNAILPFLFFKWLKYVFLLTLSAAAHCSASVPVRSFFELGVCQPPSTVAKTPTINNTFIQPTSNYPDHHFVLRFTGKVSATFSRFARPHSLIHSRTSSCSYSGQARENYRLHVSRPSALSCRVSGIVYQLQQAAQSPPH